MRKANGPFDFELDRGGPLPLGEQLQLRLRAAIGSGQLAHGARLPSWRDLAEQLGVARGTVRVAYERLVDDGLLMAAGAAGTFVHAAPPAPRTSSPASRAANKLHAMYSAPALPFQMGVPAQDAFPSRLWARLASACARDDAFAPATYGDPVGEPALRAEIAAYLAVARGIHCRPEQVLITSGFRAGLRLALDVLAIAGRKAWIEEPCFPLTRDGLVAAQLEPVPIEVDAEGIVVEHGVTRAHDAAVAVVTPGQHAPLGVTLSPGRRERLRAWAKRADAWIIEDDYLGELQLDGRAIPALAATDSDGRVFHLGTFSKTLSPALGVGFLVVPLAQAERAAALAGCLAPAPGRAAQLTLSAMLQDGHFLRHLRRMKRLYRERREALIARLGRGTPAGLAVLLELPEGTDDKALALDALQRGIAPVPLSLWFAQNPRPGLLLGVSTASPDRLEHACSTLEAVLARSGVPT